MEKRMLTFIAIAAAIGLGAGIGGTVLVQSLGGDRTNKHDVEVEEARTDAIVAAFGYDACIAGSQGKDEGSAAYGCTARGTTLDSVVKKAVTPPVPATDP